MQMDRDRESGSWLSEPRDRTRRASLHELSRALRPAVDTLAARSDFVMMPSTKTEYGTRAIVESFFEVAREMRVRAKIACRLAARESVEAPAQ
jgi:hypothetical protein